MTAASRKNSCSILRQRSGVWFDTRLAEASTVGARSINYNKFGDKPSRL